MSKWVDVTLANEHWDRLLCKIRSTSIDRFEFVDEEEIYAVVGANRYRVMWTREKLDELFEEEASGMPEYTDELRYIGGAVEDVRDRLENVVEELYEARGAKKSKVF